MVTLPMILNGSCSTRVLFAVRDTSPKKPQKTHNIIVEKSAWKNPHTWYIVTIMGALTIFYYLPNILELMNVTPANWVIFDIPHDLHRNLFFLPVFYAAYKFKTNGVISITSISAIIFIPRALLESPYSCSLLRPMIFVVVLGFSGFLLATKVTGIEEQKKLEKKIKEAERVACFYEASGMLGHDLRNPLQTIIGSINLAEETLKTFPEAENRKMQKCVKSIKEQIWYMNKIVSDLQDYARPLSLELEDVKASSVLLEALSEVKIPKGIQVTTAIPEEIILTIDPFLMRKVFVNLILNAVQALTDGGRLTIDAEKTESATYMRVEDTGVGIPEENLSKIFEPLFTTKAQGLGLGLSVCKRLVKLHGGEITVESIVGKGSIFTVKISNKKVRGISYEKEDSDSG